MTPALTYAPCWLARQRGNRWETPASLEGWSSSPWWWWPSSSRCWPAGVSRPGSRRAGLVAGGLTLGLLPPALVTSYVSVSLGGLYAAESGAAMDACASLWLLLRVAWGAFTVSRAVGFVLGLLRRGGAARRRPLLDPARPAAGRPDHAGGYRPWAMLLARTSRELRPAPHPRCGGRGDRGAEPIAGARSAVLEEPRAAPAGAW
jgi:hypothetical protein